MQLNNIPIGGKASTNTADLTLAALKYKFSPISSS